MITHSVLIAGASKGIGLKIAEKLNPNASLFTLSRTRTPELDQLGTHFQSIDLANGDLTSLQEFPTVLHGLVYCPGSIRLKPFHRLSEEDFLLDFQQNVMGAVKLLQKALPALKAANGASVVLFSTVAAKVGMPFHASIATAKAALEGLAKSLAAEWAIHKIRVNVIAPSLTNTSLAEALLDSPEKIAAASRRHPLQRVGTPEELAEVATFLLGEQSSWITGQVIGVDGGLGNLRP